MNQNQFIFKMTKIYWLICWISGQNSRDYSLFYSWKLPVQLLDSQTLLSESSKPQIISLKEWVCLSYSSPCWMLRSAPAFHPPTPQTPPLAFEIERLWEWLCHLETREPIARWEEGTTRNVSKKAEERGCWKNPENKTKYQKRGFAVVCAEVCRGKRKRWSQRADTVFLTDFWQRQSKHCDSEQSRWKASERRQRWI